MPQIYALKSEDASWIGRLKLTLLALVALAGVGLLLRNQIVGLVRAAEEHPNIVGGILLIGLVAIVVASAIWSYRRLTALFGEGPMTAEEEAEFNLALLRGNPHL